MTHTYATLEVSEATYLEIEAKFRAAGYDHAFDKDTGAIDMHGVGLVREEPSLLPGALASPARTDRVAAKPALAELAAYFRRVGDLWEGPDGCATLGTDLCQRVAADLRHLSSEPMALGLTHIPTSAALGTPAGPVVAWMWEYDSVGYAQRNRRIFTETAEPTVYLRNVFARGPWPLTRGQQK
jgi:hypothetical protein